MCTLPDLWESQKEKSAIPKDGPVPCPGKLALIREKQEAHRKLAKKRHNSFYIVHQESNAK